MQSRSGSCFYKKSPSISRFRIFSNISVGLIVQVIFFCSSERLKTFFWRSKVLYKSSCYYCYNYYYYIHLHIYRSKLAPRAWSHGTGSVEDYLNWTVEGSLPYREGQTRRRYRRTDEVAASDWLTQDWIRQVKRIMNYTWCVWPISKSEDINMRRAFEHFSVFFILLWNWKNHKPEVGSK